MKTRLPTSSAQSPVTHPHATRAATGPAAFALAASLGFGALLGPGCTASTAASAPAATPAARPATGTGCDEAPSTSASDPHALETPPDVAAPPANAEKTATGLASVILQPGCGTRHPGTFSVVRVHYTGWTTDGRMFDSSVKRGEPAQFPLNGVIPGWKQGVKMMVVGEKRRFWIPVELAYAGQPGMPEGMLVFDVELLEIVQP